MFKKLFSAFSFSLTFLLAPLSIQNAYALSCSSTGGYIIHNNQVIYRQQGGRENQNFNVPLRRADPRSFRPIITKISAWKSCVNPYGMDRDHVFYKGKIIEGVNPRNFRMHDKQQNSYSDGSVLVIHGKVVGKLGDQQTKLGGGYLKIGQNYFYHDIQLPEPIIKYIGGTFAVSRNTVYRTGKATSFDPKTFEMMGSYLRDRNGVFCGRTSKRLDADPATFTVHFQKGSFGADKDHFFFECQKVNRANGEFLDLFAHGFMRDANHVYFIKNPVQGLDADSFVVHFQGGKYIQDKNGVYFVTRKNFSTGSIQYLKVQGADLDTFQATSRSKARDIINLYKKHKRVGENWEGLKHKPNSYFRVHRKRLYKLQLPTPFAQNF